MQLIPEVSRNLQTWVPHAHVPELLSGGRVQSLRLPVLNAPPERAEFLRVRAVLQETAGTGD